jgi:hypothetical protein
MQPFYACSEIVSSDLGRCREGHLPSRFEVWKLPAFFIVEPLSISFDGEEVSFHDGPQRAAYRGAAISNSD